MDIINISIAKIQNIVMYANGYTRVCAIYLDPMYNMMHYTIHIYIVKIAHPVRGDDAGVAVHVHGSVA